MIILFTSNITGGVMQFVIRTAVSLYKECLEFKVYLPDEVQATIPKFIDENIVRYKRIKTFFSKDKRLYELANDIIALKPDMVWYCDDIIQSSQLICCLKGKTRQMLTLHDVGTFHPSNNKSLKNKLHDYFKWRTSIKAAKRADNLLVLSEESKIKYLKKNKNNENKLVLMNLGAHVPDVEPLKPEEIAVECIDYYMFFGRIDKYKGIINALNSYCKCKDIENKLIIAGRGELSIAENELINSDNRVIVINRYIADEEMIYLFQHAKALVLPYIEATQSGVIPIAYKFGKPVIVSDIEGLTQFVTDGVTGIICHNNEEYCTAYRTLTDPMKVADMGKECYEYYLKYMDWDNNVIGLLKSMELIKT